MAEGYSTGGFIARVITLLILIAVLSVVGLLWLNWLGVINTGEHFGGISRFFNIGASKRTVDVNDPELMARERFNKEIETLRSLEFEVGQRMADLTVNENRLNQWEAELTERERLLRERELVITNAEGRYADREVNLLQNARYLTNMPPQQAIQILLGMEDHDVIDTLRAAERLAANNGTASMVPVWLMMIAQLPDTDANAVPNAQRAADVVRLMAMRSNFIEE
jgi:flagellar protein FlbB